jgi:hypothetical protein
LAGLNGVGTTNGAGKTVGVMSVHHHGRELIRRLLAGQALVMPYHV